VHACALARRLKVPYREVFGRALGDRMPELTAWRLSATREYQ
jgi:hypothetical protein